MPATSHREVPHHQVLKNCVRNVPIQVDIISGTHMNFDISTIVSAPLSSLKLWCKAWSAMLPVRVSFFANRPGQLPSKRSSRDFHGSLLPIPCQTVPFFEKRPAAASHLRILPNFKKRIALRRLRLLEEQQAVYKSLSHCLYCPAYRQKRDCKCFRVGSSRTNSSSDHSPESPSPRRNIFLDHLLCDNVGFPTRKNSHTQVKLDSRYAEELFAHSEFSRNLGEPHHQNLHPSNRSSLRKNRHCHPHKLSSLAQYSSSRCRIQKSCDVTRCQQPVASCNVRQR